MRPALSCSVERVRSRAGQRAVPDPGGVLPVHIGDSFLAGRDLPIVRPLDFVAGLAVRDGHNAADLTGALSRGGPVVVGRDAAHIWSTPAPTAARRDDPDRLERHPDQVIIFRPGPRNELFQQHPMDSGDVAQLLSGQEFVGCRRRPGINDSLVGRSPSPRPTMSHTVEDVRPRRGDSALTDSAVAHPARPPGAALLWHGSVVALTGKGIRAERIVARVCPDPAATSDLLGRSRGRIRR